MMCESSLEEHTYQYTIETHADRPLKDILTGQYSYSSRLLRQIKREGRITINGRDCWLTEPVKKGDKVEVVFPEEPFDIIPVEGDIDIIYEDDEILVVNKQADCVTHPTHSHQEDTLANFVAWYWQKKGTPHKVRFVNRLDRDTTGLVVMAKNKYVHHYIQSRMKSDAVEKTYLAFVNGVPSPAVGCINAPIDRPSEDSIERKVMASGKPSVTHYETLETYQDAALLKLRLETGRTHQIRVHLSHMGWPIIGDSLYNKSGMPDYGMAHQALHAWQLQLVLPKRGKLTLTAPLTKDLQLLRNKIQRKKEER